MRLPGHFGDETDGKTSSGFAPQKASTTNRRLPESCLSPGLSDVARFPEREVCYRSSFAFVCPPESIASGIVTDDILSFGERPVKIPVSTATAPRLLTPRAHNLSGSDRALPDTAVVAWVVNDIMYVTDTISLEFCGVKPLLTRISLLLSQYVLPNSKVFLGVLTATRLIDLRI